MGLYIPSNPFNSLANNVVPAVVVFSVVLGIALIGVPHKQPLLDVLAVVSAAVSRATNFIVSLTPYGIFAIAAVTSGTLDLEALQRIQVYLLSYIAVSLLLVAVDPSRPGGRGDARARTGRCSPSRATR